MMFDSLLTKLETELRDGMSLAVAGFVTTACAQLEGALAEVDKERANGLAAVAKERDIALAEVDTRRAELTREVAAMHRHKEAQEGRVELNIGGYRFETSVQTLRRIPHTFFDAYFSGRYAQDVCNDGSIFEDRDGAHFGYVLEFLRDGVISMADRGASELDVSVLRWLKREFGFYCIELSSKDMEETAFAVGGRKGFKMEDIISSVERYDSVSNAWHSAASMAMARQEFAICAHADNLYVIGGQDADGVNLASVERYNRVSGTWSEAPAMPRARWEHVACAIGDTLYVFGGSEEGIFYEEEEDDYRPTDSMLKFDIRTELWTEMTSKWNGRGIPAVCVLGSAIYIFGGDEWDAHAHSNRAETSTTFRINTETEQWSMLAPMPQPKTAHGACVLNGLIYVIGGFQDGCALDSVHRFDPATNTWSTLASMTFARATLQTFVLDGSIYAIGGWNSSPERALRMVERYDVSSDTWTVVSDMAMGVGRSSFGAVVMGGPQEVDLFDSLVAKARRSQQ
jgi:N-acetylneuraminic acid mutarotase